MSTTDYKHTLKLPPGLKHGDHVKITAYTKVEQVWYAGEDDGDDGTYDTNYLETEDLGEFDERYGNMSSIQVEQVEPPLPTEKFSIIEARDMMTRDVQNLVLLNNGWLTDDGSIWSQGSFEVVRVVRQGA